MAEKGKYPVVIDSSTEGEIADPWEQQGLTPYGQYFENLNEYVDPLTGHLTIRHTDYHLSGRGLDLTVTRVYSTVVAYKEDEDTPGAYIPIATYQEAPTDLGSGWSLDFPWLEIKDDQPGKYLHLPQGVQVKTQFQNGVWVNETYGFTMYQLIDNTYVRYRNNGIEEEFDTEGRIISITDLNGNSLTFTYVNELLYSITDTVGRVLTFTYAGDKLVQISDGFKTITYNYSGDKLVSVQDPLGRLTTYGYLAQNSFLITGVHYPTGGFSSYEYAAILPDSGKLAPYKASQLNDGITAYYVYKVDSSDTVTWTSPQDINAVTISSGNASTTLVAVAISHNGSGALDLYLSGSGPQLLTIVGSGNINIHIGTDCTGLVTLDMNGTGIVTIFVPMGQSPPQIMGGGDYIIVYYNPEDEDKVDDEDES